MIILWIKHVCEFSEFHSRQLISWNDILVHTCKKEGIRELIAQNHFRRKIGFCRSQNRFTLCPSKNRFLPILYNRVFVDLKPVYADLKTGICRSQKLFFQKSSSLMDLKTGFCRSQNWFMFISKKVFADPKSGLVDLKIVMPISKQVFLALKTGLSWYQNRFLPISKPVFVQFQPKSFFSYSKPVFVQRKISHGSHPQNIPIRTITIKDLSVCYMNSSKLNTHANACINRKITQTSNWHTTLLPLSGRSNKVRLQCLHNLT